MEEQVQAVTSFVDTIVDFAVSYGFQIAGALLILILGLRLARWGGGRVTRIAESRGIDPTLSRFIGNIIRFVVVVFVLIIAMGNLGVELAPIVAFVGAGALGATFALQGGALELRRRFGVDPDAAVRGRQHDPRAGR